MKKSYWLMFVMAFNSGWGMAIPQVFAEQEDVNVYVKTERLYKRYYAAWDKCNIELIIFKQDFMHIISSCDGSINEITDKMRIISQRTDLRDEIKKLKAIRYLGSRPDIAKIHWNKLIEAANKSDIWPYNIYEHEKTLKRKLQAQAARNEQQDPYKGRSVLLTELLVSIDFIRPLRTFFSEYGVELHYKANGRSLEKPQLISSEELVRRGILHSGDVKKKYYPEYVAIILDADQIKDKGVRVLENARTNAK